MSCDLCGNAGHQCPFEPIPFDDLLTRAVEKAVREKREATVRYIREKASPNGYYHFVAAAIERGEHRK